MSRRLRSGVREDGAIDRHRCRRSEDGDTLIEVLLAIVVLGLASVAILVAFATGISGSAEHRNLATMDTVLRTAAEQAISQIGAQTNAQFEQCPVPNSVTFNLPPGYSATVAPSGYATQYWSSATSIYSTTCSSASTPAAPVLNAPELVTITVKSSAGLTSAPLSFVVTDSASRPLPVVGAATHLVFLTSPGQSQAGVNFSSNPTVAVEDSNGNIVTSDFSAVNLTISTNTPIQGGPGALSNSCQGVEFQGVVTFSGCSINTVGKGYTLTASDAETIAGTSNALTPATSSPFDITAGQASQLAFSTQPVGGVTEATNFVTEPVVTVEDANGNVVTNDTGSVTLSVASYTASNGGSNLGAVGCANTTVNAVAGVATFANCQISGTSAAGTYMLSAGRSGLQAATSASLTINAGPAAKLVFTTQPGGGANGSALNTQPAVTVEDSFGNTVTSSPVSVSLGLASQPGTGAALSCGSSNSVTVVSGVASFAGCQIVGKTGSYTLSATSSGLSVTSTSLTLTVGNPAKLAFTTAPVGGVKEATNFTTSPTVTVEDSGGNTVTTDTGSVALSIASYTAGSGGSVQGVVGCSHTTMNATAGVAAFTNCQITGNAGAGTYTLSAARTGLTSGTSGNVSIIAGTAFQIAITPSPTTVAASSTTNVQLNLQLQDSSGNNVATGGPASVTLGSPSTKDFFASTLGANGATILNNSISVTMTGGAGSTYYGDETAETPIFTAVNGSTTWPTSASLTINAGPAAKLVFTTQPGGGANGSALNTQPAVTVEDSFGNTVTSSPVSVSLGLASQPGTGAALSCGSSNSVTVVSGVASFAGCQIVGKTGSYTLSATSSGLSVTSTSLTLTVGNPAKLAFTTAPVGGVKEATNFTTSPTVTVEDSGGNTVTTDTGSVALSIASYTAGSGGSVQGVVGCSHTTMNATAGVAAFTNCQITGNAGAGTYTLSAARTGLTSGTSGNVSIIAGTAFQIAITPSPTTVAASSTTNVQLNLQLQDSSGNNVATGGPASVTLGSPSTKDFFASTLGANGATILNNSISVTMTGGAGSTYYGDETAETPIFTAVNGSTTWPTVPSLTINAGPAAGLALSNASTKGTTTNVCTTLSSSYSCTWSGGGNSDVLTANVAFVDQFGNPTVESATAASPLSLSGSSVSPSLLSVLAGTTTSTGTFKLTMSGSTAATTTIKFGTPTTYTLNVTLQK